MSVGMFNVPSSLPPEERECPVCGATMPAKADMCWLCLRKSIKDEAAPAPVRKRRKNPVRPAPKPWAREPALIVLGIMAVVLSGVLLVEMPGMLIVLLFGAAPVLVHMFVDSRRRRTVSNETALSQHDPATTPPVRRSAIQAVLNGIGIAIVVGLVSFTAFWAAFIAICTGAIMLAPRLSDAGFAFFAIACVVGGVVAAILAVVQISSMIRPK